MEHTWHCCYHSKMMEQQHLVERMDGSNDFRSSLDRLLGSVHYAIITPLLKSENGATDAIKRMDLTFCLLIASSIPK